MNRQVLIDKTMQKISLLSDKKIKEVSDFTDYLLSRMDEKNIETEIRKMISESKSFDFLADEDSLYSAEDLRRHRTD
jgi:hypothetical protein